MLYGFEEDWGIYIPPKYRRSADNPYRLSRREGGRYWVSFPDGEGNEQEAEVSDAVFRHFEAWELEDLSEMNEKDNHGERLQQSEEAMFHRSSTAQPSAEEVVEQRDEIQLLYRAIEALPLVQRHRLVLYYFQDMTYEQISILDKCTIMPVKRSIELAVEKIRKIFIQEGLILPEKLGTK